MLWAPDSRAPGTFLTYVNLYSTYTRISKDDVFHTNNPNHTTPWLILKSSRIILTWQCKYTMINQILNGRCWPRTQTHYLGWFNSRLRREKKNQGIYNPQTVDCFSFQLMITRHGKAFLIPNFNVDSSLASFSLVWWNPFWLAPSRPQIIITANSFSGLGTSA